MLAHLDTVRLDMSAQCYKDIVFPLHQGYLLEGVSLTNDDLVLISGQLAK